MVARTAASGEALFDIIPTRAALLADIPGLQPPLRRARAVSEDVLTAALAPLRPVSSSSGVRDVLQALEQRRFAEAVREVPLPEAERGLVELCRAVAFYGLGDTPASLAARLARAEALGAPVAAVRYWQGWVLALQSRDTDAVSAWREAQRLGWPQALTAPLEVEALLRLRQSADAGAAAARAIAGGLTNETLHHSVALAALDAGHPDQALAALAPVLATTNDADTLWLAIRAHAESGLRSTTPLSPEERSTFTALVDRYRRSDGRHRERADEWLAFLTASSSAA
jgi:hypothetical protein